MPDAAVMEAVERCLRATARAGGDLALHCDRVEHVEPATARTVAEAAEALRTTATDTAARLGFDVFEAYVRRLREIESRGVAPVASAYDGAAAAAAAASWADLQRVQRRHDAEYHADVIGLSRLDQLRHCTLHVAKLSGWFAACLDNPHHVDELRRARLADLLLFGLKVATIAHHRLPDAPLPRGVPAALTRAAP